MCGHADKTNGTFSLRVTERLCHVAQSRFVTNIAISNVGFQLVVCISLWLSSNLENTPDPSNTGPNNFSRRSRRRAYTDTVGSTAYAIRGLTGSIVGSPHCTVLFREVGGAEGPIKP